MTTIVSSHPHPAERRAPGSPRFAQWLDELAPVLLLAAVLALLAVAAREAHASAAAPRLAVGVAIAE
ncbi:MAG TPA: hypothetical protein VFJ86_05655 [Usitatibacter sp.]|jgi:hypothetical protein|nr:hypothetical protein [Usitatibacter sp.]